MTESQAKSYEKIMKSFVMLLKEKNPNLEMNFHVSFDALPKEYQDGKYVAGADNQPGKPEFILQVSDDFELPVDAYNDRELSCTSWRNNNYNGGLPENVSELQKEQLPVDFDVIRISGAPKEDDYSVMPLSLYVIGGCAKQIATEKKM